MIPLGFAQHISWAPSRTPTNLDYTILSLTKVTVQQITCVHFPVCTAYCTFCIYHYWHSFCFILRFSLFRYSLFNCLVIDYFRLLSLLCIIPILEMHSSYFNPGNNSNIAILYTSYYSTISTSDSNLAQGFRRPIATIVVIRGVQNQFLQLGLVRQECKNLL
jgi:hypothetical protein